MVSCSSSLCGEHGGRGGGQCRGVGQRWGSRGTTTEEGVNGRAYRTRGLKRARAHPVCVGAVCDCVAEPALCHDVAELIAGALLLGLDAALRLEQERRGGRRRRRQLGDAAGSGGGGGSGGCGPHRASRGEGSAGPGCQHGVEGWLRGGQARRRGERRGEPHLPSSLRPP